MTSDELSEFIARGHETNGVEFKGPGPGTNQLLRAKVVRAAMGMANRKDGGWVILGVEDDGQNLTPVGVNDEDVASWAHDPVSTFFAQHAEPSIDFERYVVKLRGENFVVLRILEFRDYPILCKKPITVNGRIELKEGACYVRSRRKSETAEVSTHEDMRELIDLARDKGVTRWVSQAQSAGVLQHPKPQQPSSGDLFRDQLGNL